jgi:hypothetical protein
LFTLGVYDHFLLGFTSPPGPASDGRVKVEEEEAAVRAFRQL